MPPVGLRLRLVVPLAWVLIIYGISTPISRPRRKQSEIMAEATVSTLRLANTVRKARVMPCCSLAGKTCTR